MQSNAQHFFETDASQELRERRAAKAGNKYGRPVTLKSKLLAVLADPASASHVFVAESAGAVRRVDVDSSDAGGNDESAGTVPFSSYRGPTAPVTCLALGGPNGQTLFAGSWDRSVWSWDRATRAPKTTYTGHTDFVKAVVAARLGERDVLISGGADKKILVWDVASGTRLHTLQDSSPTAGRASMLAVQALAVDPVATTADEVVLVSASSDPHIRRWRIRADGWTQVVEAEPEAKPEAENPEKSTTTLLAHETTVYKVVFESADGDDDDVDLWTASADGTAKRLVRAHGFRHRAGDAGSTFVHGTHARAVAVTESWVVTAGRDEDVQVWDRHGDDDDGDNDDDDVGRPYATLTGHYDEVTDLAVLADGRRVASVGLDGTVRTWPLAKPELDAIVQEQKADRDKAAAGVVDEVEAVDGLLTAEEEAELAALMED